MPARSAVQKLLETDSDLADTHLVEKVYASNSVDTPAESIFIVIRWDPTSSAFKNKGSDRCSIWVHDKARDYGKIDLIHQRIQELMTSSVHYDGEDGWTMTLAEWRGEGPDVFDQAFGTCTRFADYVVVSRYTAS